MDSNVLVTGGSGFLGLAIVKRLLEKDVKVTSFSRNSHAELQSLGVRQVLGDLKNFADTLEAVKGQNVVFHVAAKAGIWGPYQDYFDTNVTGTHNILAACEKHGVSRLIHTSSPGVVFDGTNFEGCDESCPYPATYLTAYPETKMLAEKAVIQAAQKGLATIILRPHLIWGPGDNHLVPRILQSAHRLKQVGNGQNLVDTIYIDNAAEAHLLADRALQKNPKLSGKAYFISQDDPEPLWEMINAILTAGGKPAVKRKISARKAYVTGTILEKIYRFLRIRHDPPITRFVASELSTSHWFDISAAKKDLGYRPVISIEEGLEKLRQAIKSGAYRIHP